MNIIKKDGTLEEYNEQKIINACSLAAKRALVNLTDNDYSQICNRVLEIIDEEDYFVEEYDNELIPVSDMHSIVEKVLLELFPTVGEQYIQYRNYKINFVKMLDEVYSKEQEQRYVGDVSNANTDSTMVSTQRSLSYATLSKELYKYFFLTINERQASKDGYIYIHDMAARRDSMNCFSRETRFITDRGVKSFYDFYDGEEIKVLTHKGNWKKAIVRSYGYQKLQKVTFKRANSNLKEVFCTANHRWILKDGTETTNLSIGDKLIAAPNISDIKWDNTKQLEKLLWCIGFGIADGAIVNHNNIPTMTIRLCGHKTEFCKCFEDAGFIVAYPESLNGDGIVRMHNIHSKDIPWLILNNENVKYFIAGWLAADGHIGLYKSNKYRGLQVTGKANEYIYDLLNMSGYYVTNLTDLTNQETNYGIRSAKTVSYGFHSNQADRTWVVENIEPAYINGNAQVWCLEVEDDHSFILENGIPTGNCCLFDAARVLKDGFEMGNVWYNEPKTLDVTFDVIGDMTFGASSQQYGGFTIPRVDTILAPYAEKSYQIYYDEAMSLYADIDPAGEWKPIESQEEMASIYATEKVRKDFEQGFQGWEYKFNTVGSSRGDYPFIAISFGTGTSKWEVMASEMALKVRMKGQGKEGFKKPVLFPKLTFLYDENLHGEGKEFEWLFEIGVECSMKTMYPDWLSLTGEGYIPSMYKRYGKVVSLMGCRASLSPWYERGGMHPADENDVPIFEGRFNLGAISLHLPMILAKARQENKDFYEVLDYYLEMIRNLHKRTYAFLGEKKASTNPLGFTQGGFLGGTLKPDDKIKSILPPMTMSFGITALNELQQLYNGKSLVEDGEFALEVMQYINDYVNRIKEEDHILYAIYGTPAESLCGLQVEQFRKKYGIIENVSDRPYVSNSFHCHVSEDITPIQKQDLEGRFWNLFNGGKIQYCKYPIDYNKEAVKTLIRRAMEKGYYEGVNLSLAYCEDCGYQELEMDICPKCGSSMITKIDRMNGYLQYSRVHGKTRSNSAKMAEIADRKSM